MGDKIHAEKALQFVGRSVKAGNTTPEQAAHIREMAHEELGTPNTGRPKPSRGVR